MLLHRLLVFITSNQLQALLKSGLIFQRYAGQADETKVKKKQTKIMFSIFNYPIVLCHLGTTPLAFIGFLWLRRLSGSSTNQKVELVYLYWLLQLKCRNVVGQDTEAQIVSSASIKV